MPEERKRKRDVLALALLALGLFLLVALITYHPADLADSRSLSPLASAGRLTQDGAPAASKPANACGRSGANAAEGLFRLLGWGAYFFVLSLLAFDVWLLLRRPVNDVVLRISGWLMTLIGVTTLLALIGPPISPGPLIGPGGYLGAAGRALLEINFAITGAFILTVSLLSGGLILSMDYLALRLAAAGLRVPLRLAATAGRISSRTLSGAGRQQTDLDNFNLDGEPAVVIRGKRIGACTGEPTE